MTQSTLNQQHAEERSCLRDPSEARIGANCTPGGACEFLVWAPRAKRVRVSIPDMNRSVDLAPQARGYYWGTQTDLEPLTRYMYTLDDATNRADPASRYQPDGVFGPSQIIEPSAFTWHDREWHGLPLSEYILYELHVGVYTKAGSFEALIECIKNWKSLGVTAIELMPVAQFPGARNWGYDGAFPFAVQNSYGGPNGLQRFVDACHQERLAVVLDVVYNHLGPEGNYLADFGPYFTDRYQTPWGPAVNFDGQQSDEVVRFFVENALYWLQDFHLDALRLDAIHGIFDRNAQPFLALLSAAVDKLAIRTQRQIHLIAETDLNDPRFVVPRSAGGHGIHAQWNDDFHHSLHSLQTGERSGYYRDFGSLHQLETAMQRGYVYVGQYSEFRQRRQGNSSAAIRPSQLVVYSQNHDQVGNRMLGERSSTFLSFEAQKLSAAVVVLSRNLPLLFMGEEYGEIAPFLYFTDHADRSLGEAVREGRRADFAEFYSEGEFPDPQSESTYQKSRLDHNLLTKPRHRALCNFYRGLIRLRTSLPALRELDTCTFDLTSYREDDCLRVLRSYEHNEVALIFNFGARPTDCRGKLPSGKWHKCLNSADLEWMGPGSNIPKETPESIRSRLLIEPSSVCVFQRYSRRENVSSSH